MENIIMFSNSETEPLDNVYQVFVCMCESNIKMKLSKCDFFFQKSNPLFRAVALTGMCVTINWKTWCHAKISSNPDNF